MSIRVSIVVPTYRRPHLLRSCLYALLKQEFPAHAYEIIVVDDAGSDETRSLAENFSRETKRVKMQSASGTGPGGESCSNIRYAAATQTRGPAAARNIGWRMARGEIIAFTDDDCLPEPGWLKEGLAAIETGFDAVSGQVIVPIPQSPTDNQKNVAKLMEGEFVTANCFCRRSALELSGGFDESFTMAWREDSDLQFRLLELSYRLGNAPAAKVIHPVRPAPWGSSIKEQRKSMFNALLYKKYPGLYRARIQSRPPLNYYAIVFCAIGFFAALGMGYRYVAWGMALLWAGLTIYFALTRLQQTQRSASHIFEMLFTSIVIPPLSIFWRLAGALYYRVLFF